MAARFVSLVKVEAARKSLRQLARHKPPKIRTAHYATFLENITEIKALLRRGAMWDDIRQRYFGTTENPPTVRSLQRYYNAALEQRK